MKKIVMTFIIFLLLLLFILIKMHFFYKEEIKYIYTLEKKKEKDTIFFEGIETFANLEKITKDNSLKAVINLVKYKNNWYWKTEIMTDDDKEYIIKLPRSVIKKILYTQINKFY